MTNQFTRSQLLLGKESIEKLKKARIAVFGIGGVGGYAVEALARSGIGSLDLIDSDKVCLSNLNRQIIALHSTIGQYKVDVAAQRIKDIFPECKVKTYKTFYLPDTQDLFDFAQYDYIIDAIDTVSGKLGLIENAKKHEVPIISAMGAGNKLDPTAFVVTDIYKTSVCPLAKVMRKECKKRGIKSLKVVYSQEEPIEPTNNTDEENTASVEESDGNIVKKRSTPGSVSFVPSVVGLILAGEAIKDIIGYNKSDK